VSFDRTGNPRGMDRESKPPCDDAGADAVAEGPAPPLPDDPRVPTPEDADPSRSRELGGAAPAVGPETSR
jgi:hypothetical protein